MFNPFSRKRKMQETEIQEIKRKHRKATAEAKQAIVSTNKVLTNGFAIKVYHAKGGHHA